MFEHWSCIKTVLASCTLIVFLAACDADTSQDDHSNEDTYIKLPVDDAMFHKVEQEIRDARLARLIKKQPWLIFDSPTGAKSTHRSTDSGVSSTAATGEAATSELSWPYPTAGVPIVPNQWSKGEKKSESPDTQIISEAWGWPVEQVQYCYEVNKRSRCLTRQTFADLLKKGQYYINGITDMFVGKTYDIGLAIDSSGNFDLQKEFKGMKGEVLQGTTKVWNVMEAELRGPTFIIKPKGRIRREHSEAAPTRWEWSVEPTQVGPRRPLQFFVYAVFFGSDNKKIVEKEFLLAQHVVKVNVTWIDYLAGMSTKIQPIYTLFAAIVMGISGLLGWLGFRRYKPGRKE